MTSRYDDDQFDPQDDARETAPGADPDCPYCHGSGKVYDTVDWWGAAVSMESGCECVYADDPSDDGQPSDLQEQADFAGDDDWASMPLGGGDDA